MIPEVFECPRCERQFVIDSVPDDGSEEVHCPQCSRFLGVRDVAFVLRTELDEMIERLSFEKDRLEKDEAVYSLTDCDAEMKFYGQQSHWINYLILIGYDLIGVRSIAKGRMTPSLLSVSS